MIQGDSEVLEPMPRNKPTWDPHRTTLFENLRITEPARKADPDKTTCHHPLHCHREEVTEDSHLYIVPGKSPHIQQLTVRTSRTFTHASSTKSNVFQISLRAIPTCCKAVISQTCWRKGGTKNEN